MSLRYILAKRFYIRDYRRIQQLNPKHYLSNPETSSQEEILSYLLNQKWVLEVALNNSMKGNRLNRKRGGQNQKELQKRIRKYIWAIRYLQKG